MTIKDLLINEWEFNTFQKSDTKLKKIEGGNELIEKFCKRRISLLKESIELPGNYDTGKNLSKISENYWDNENLLTLKKDFPYTGIYARKPGRKQIPVVTKDKETGKKKTKIVSKYDINFVLLHNGEELKDFTTFTQMWNPVFLHSDDDFVNNFIVMIYRMGYMFDYDEVSKNKWRLKLPKELEKYFNQEKIEISVKGKVYSIPALSLLHFIEGIFIDEDLRYFKRTRYFGEFCDEERYVEKSEINNNWNWKIGRITHALTWCQILNARKYLFGSSATKEQKHEFYLDTIANVRRTGTEPQMKELVKGEVNEILKRYIDKNASKSY